MTHSTKQKTTTQGAHIVNLGCRLNISEGQQIQQMLAHKQYDNHIIINSCAVTKEAERKSLQTAKKLKKQAPHKKLIFTGCAAQINPEKYQNHEAIDTVIGNHEKMALPDLLDKNPDDGFSMVGDIFSITETALHLNASYGDSHTRAFVQIQNGCDHRCTFCIIPYGRGNSRSIPMKQILAHIKELVTEGVQEVVLTGVDLTSYRDDENGKMISLGRLVAEILDTIPDLPRLRLSSLDCIEADDALCDSLSDERLMPHLHLSLQSGDDLILKRMKRRHSRNDAIAFCEKLRSIRPDIVFGADLIAGFPTETDEHFANSCRLIAECGLTWLHIFPFSARAQTPAARMPALPKPLIAERAKILRMQAQTCQTAYLKSLTGKILPILFERNGTGYSPHFALVKLEQEQQSDAQQNRILPVTITDSTKEHVMGRLA